jgi:hypothetical protein
MMCPKVNIAIRNIAPPADLQAFFRPGASFFAGIP